MVIDALPPAGRPRAHRPGGATAAKSPRRLLRPARRNLRRRRAQSRARAKTLAHPGSSSKSNRSRRPQPRQTAAAEKRAEARAKGYEGEACGECGNFTLVRNGT